MEIMMKKVMMTMKKAMMKMKKAMMTTMDMKDMAMEHTIHTSGLTQIESYMQPNI